MPPLLEVVDLVRGVEADRRLELDVLAALAVGGHRDGPRLAVLEVADVEGLLAGEAE